MLFPQIQPPFPMRWGFTTKMDGSDNHPPEFLDQVHGDWVLEADGSMHTGDGLWTCRPGMRIGVQVADCAPILLAGLLGPDQPWVAALHAGWRGAAAGILRKGVHIFRNLGGDLSQLHWAIGPCIQRSAFEVGWEVVEICRRDPAWSENLIDLQEKPHLDLPGFLTAQALDEGLSSSLDGSLRLCTFHQTELLWSYRRGDREPRQWGWVEILGTDF